MEVSFLAGFVLTLYIGSKLMEANQWKTGSGYSSRGIVYTTARQDYRPSTKASPKPNGTSESSSKSAIAKR